MTVFLAGVHGVGKTYLAKQACESLGVRHATASQLIREERGSASWTAEKLVQEIDANQVALVTAVNRIRELGHQLLLDGHFVLRTQPSVHESIGAEVFGQLGIKAVIVLTAPDELVLSRLRERSDQTWTAEEVGELAKIESAQAAAIAKKLMLPCVSLHCPSVEKLSQAICIAFARAAA
ncbi:AAA family ATPase [Pelomonas sp. V22]|uniref:ATP-binding protein n=1 Tax=Pelomonas sp. V22 TaxID=2822139 RepID=UPI0024A968FB|nr:ATP-binding protein [Pelomonas sp. V22]MDI4633138.1 AAA family ATPase [Pelomonas sp. V22]